MSLAEFDRMKLMRAIADADESIPLNSCKELDADGVCAVIARLRSQAVIARSQEMVLNAECEREKWLRECLEKDLAKMTEYRDNAKRRVDIAERERDEALAKKGKAK